MIRFPSNLEPQESYRLAHALFYMGTLDETRPAKEWLESELKRLDKENRTEIDEVTLRQRQGAIQAVATLLSEMEKASERARL